MLEHWPVRGAGRASASRASGAGAGRSAPIEYEGETYGLRVHEFRQFAELPRRSAEPFEVALDIDEADAADLELLRDERLAAGRPGAIAAADPWAYRDYVQGSKAELMVAKNMYVRARSGWFSDRSICYLASGRPGARAGHRLLASSYPTGEGLLAFSTSTRRVAGVEEIARDYAAPSRGGARARRGALRLRTGARQAAAEAWGSAESTMSHHERRPQRPEHPSAPAGVRRLNWGCGEWAGAGLDQLRHQGRARASTSSCDIRDGLPLEDDSIDYAVSIHALPEIPLHRPAADARRSCAAC